MYCNYCWNIHFWLSVRCELIPYRLGQKVLLKRGYLPAEKYGGTHQQAAVLGQRSYGSRHAVIQGESLARCPKLLSIRKYVIEKMTWKFIYTYRERCKTGPAHNRCWNWRPFTSKHTWMRFSKLWNTLPKVSTLTAWISWRIASLKCSIVRVVFLYNLPPNRAPKKKVGRS